MSHPPPATRDVVFVDDQYWQSHPKKRQAERACDDCRRRKKRCDHEKPTAADTRPVDTPTGSAAHGTSVSSGNAQRNPTASISSLEPSTARSPAFVRFIGDLNPERQLRTPSSRISHPNETHVGFWHEEPSEVPPALAGLGPASLFHHCSSMTRRLMPILMEEECCAVLPGAHHLVEIETYYFSHVHPILPARDVDLYRASPAGSAQHTLQAQSLCLAAHANASVRDHLRLPDFEGPVPPSTFARRVLGAMRLNIELALTTDKSVLIRTLATMSLFAYTSDALELNCHFFNRAVHAMSTMGLHQTRLEHSDPALDNLFCYLWTIDRLHAAMQGRPVVIHERDMSIPVLERTHALDPAFKVFVHIASLLDFAIDLYRPNSTLTEIPSSQIPLFEELLKRCGAQKLPSHICETLELFYNAVAILSCRSRPDLAGHDSLSPQARQSHAASQVLAILDEDITQEVVLLQHVPYSASLALSTAYRQIRGSELPRVRLRARKQIFQALRHLKRMSAAFWSATVMAELARKALVETRDAGVEDVASFEADSRSAQPDEGIAGDRIHPSRRHSIYDLGYVTANQDLNGFEWHSFQEPDETPLFDLNNLAWDSSCLDGLLDANLELGFPNSVLV